MCFMCFHSVGNDDDNIQYMIMVMNDYKNANNHDDTLMILMMIIVTSATIGIVLFNVECVHYWNTQLG